MLTASVVWGIVLSTKAFPGQRRPAWLLDLHRWLGGLTVSFVVIHLAALVADSFVSFDLVDLTVPFASAWKPVPVALGVVAMWLLIAVQATSLAMKRLPRRAWRWIHLSSYAVFFLTSLHAAFAGTDQSNRLYQLTGTAAIAAVTWATVYRLTHRRRVDPVRRAPTSRSHEREDDATDHGAFAGS
jgi:DMSO/TMAO reductase YedYZ heme-binding membrane subunit